MIKIEHLTKKFEDNMILDDVSLTVHRGEVIVVVGPSGCGKSTMLRCINALEPTQGGTIEIEGQQISQSSKNLTQLRQKIGMVFQSYELFPHLTVLNNILLAPAKVQKRDKEEVTSSRNPSRTGAETGLGGAAGGLPIVFFGSHWHRIDFRSSGMGLGWQQIAFGSSLAG